MTTSELIRFPVFKDDKGNRFVFPGLYQGGSGGYQVLPWGFCRAIEVALRVEEEKDTLDIPLDPDGGLTFPHVPADAGSPGFMHGHGKVWIIGGPEFDAALAEQPA